MASSSTVTSSTPRKTYIVTASEQLRSLISTVKKLNTVTTSADVLDGLKIYIMRKKLFNPLDPNQILCSGDELGVVLGTENFTIPEVWKLLQKHIRPVRININNSGTMQAAIAVCDVAGKRKSEDSEGGGPIKKLYNEVSRDPMFLFIPPSPRKEDYSSDTADSIQGYETAFVKDSSDDSISSCFDDSDDLHPGDILAIEETFDVEYEIESDSDEEIKISVSDSGSDSENVVDTVLSFVCKSDSDEQFWADKSSDENFDSDLEIPVTDKWECKNCGSFNNPPMRYCNKCWYMRSGWIVPKRSERRTRHKQRSKRNKKVEESSTNSREEFCSPKPATSSSSGSALEMPNSDISKNNNKKAPKSNSVCTLQTPDTSSDISSTDLPTNSYESFQEYSCSTTSCLQKLPNSFSDVSSSSQELSTLSSYSSSQEFPSTSSYSSSQEYPSTSYNSKEFLNSSKDIVSSLNNFQTLNLSTVPKCEADAKLCLLCCVRPANASIIHGKYAHQISCYRCAKKLQLEGKRCPVCRRTIDRVVHQILAL